MSEFDFRRSILPPTATLRRAVEVMTGPDGIGVILVADRSDVLKGMIVDFDIRKAILKGRTMDAKLRDVMNPKPFTLSHDASDNTLSKFFRANERAYVPLVDARFRLKGLARMVDYLAPRNARPNWIVLLAGGLGTRLYPLTENRPKPLLPVGNKPILETIVEQFTTAGFRKIMFAVHHQADQIRAHFGDGRAHGAQIRYIEEKKRLGTAGPLSLLPRKIDAPIIVMNGDLLTKVDFRALLDYHEAERSMATVCVREYEFQVPFGVVQMDGHKLERMVEKPTHRFFVNAGIYVIDPRALSLLERNETCDMPAFLERIGRRKRRSIGCFPIREYWIDIGRLDEYKRANVEYEKHF